MHKSKFKTQKNGRERGLSGNGDGAHQEVSPMARGTTTKTKRERVAREDRREKSRGWDA